MLVHSGPRTLETLNWRCVKSFCLWHPIARLLTLKLTRTGFLLVLRRLATTLGAEILTDKISGGWAWSAWFHTMKPCSCWNAKKYLKHIVSLKQTDSEPSRLIHFAMLICTSAFLRHPACHSARRLWGMGAMMCSLMFLPAQLCLLGYILNLLLSVVSLQAWTYFPSWFRLCYHCLTRPCGSDIQC